MFEILQPVLTSWKYAICTVASMIVFFISGTAMWLLVTPFLEATLPGGSSDEYQILGFCISTAISLWSLFAFWNFFNSTQTWLNSGSWNGINVYLFTLFVFGVPNLFDFSMWSYLVGIALALTIPALIWGWVNR